MKRIIFPLALVLGAAGVYFVTTDERPLPDPGAIEVGGDYALYVGDQAPSWTLVATLAIMKEDGYVVIHALKDDGGPGDVIGHSELLLPGRHENIDVKLDRAPNDGERLYATLYDDNGDGAFSAPNDAPARDSAGNMMTMLFQTSAEPEESIEE